MTPTRTCYRHPDRETFRSCTRCERPACTSCLVEAPVGAHCPECAKPAVRPRTAIFDTSAAGAATAVTLAIIGANVAVALLGVVRESNASVTGRDDLAVDLGLAARFVRDGEWYRLVTAGFTHAGILHLAFNMIVIWQFGSLLEPAIGKPRFIALYLASLLAGSAGALLLSPDALTVGASGAAFGLVGAAAVGFQRRGINIFQAGIGTMLVINLVITFALPGISIGGHLGGLAGGALVGAAYFWSDRGPPVLPVSLVAAGGVMLASFLVAALAVGP